MSDSENYDEELEAIKTGYERARAHGWVVPNLDDEDDPKEGEDVLARARKYTQWIKDKQKIKGEIKVFTYELLNGSFYHVRRFVYDTKLIKMQNEFSGAFNRGTSMTEDPTLVSVGPVARQRFYKK